MHSNESMARKRDRRPVSDAKDSIDGKNQPCDELVKPDIEISSIPSDDLKCEKELALIEQTTNATNTVLCSLSQLEINPNTSDAVTENHHVDGMASPLHPLRVNFAHRFDSNCICCFDR